MFRSLLVHLQEALHTQQLVYVLRACYVSTPILVAANRYNMHAIYQLLFVYRLLKMSK
jgi:hypothetical protein